MSWSVPDVPCLPSNVPTADTKAAVFTILVIFHYITPLHHPRNSIVVFPHSGLRRWMRHVRRESDRCLVLRSQRSQGYSRQGFSDISHRTLEIVEETEELQIIWPLLCIDSDSQFSQSFLLYWGLDILSWLAEYIAYMMSYGWFSVVKCFHQIRDQTEQLLDKLSRTSSPDESNYYLFHPRGLRKLLKGKRSLKNRR